MAESLRLSGTAITEGQTAESPAGERAGERVASAVAMRVRGLTVAAGNRSILDRVDLDVRERRVLAIVGPSGAGKSTLLKCFNRLIDLEQPRLEVRGSIELDGLEILTSDRDVDELRARVGMIFQQPVIFPGSVADNVLFGARRRERLTHDQARERIEDTLRAVALWEEVCDRLGSSAAKLSVGQQQRLCLARALAVGPRVLLMDEPTSALDRASKAAIESRIRTLAERHTVVLVTHDLEQAERCADHVAFLCPRPAGARVAEVASSETFFSRPESPESAAFLGCFPVQE